MSIIIMVEILRWLTSNFQSSKRAPRREPLPVGSAASSANVPAAPPTPVQVVHTLTSAEIEALIEDRLKTMKESLRLEMEAFKQGLAADARSAATTTTTRIESLGSSSSLTSGAGVGDIMSDPNNQRNAAAAAVVSSTLATVVALAAATAQCNPLNAAAAASAEEKI